MPSRSFSFRQIDRREMLLAAGAASAALVSRQGVAADRQSSSGGSHGFTICAFEKFLQELTYEELSDVIVELGFDGIEATVRKGGHVAPERVAEDLPKLVKALDRNGLAVTVMATDVRDAASDLDRRVLETAADLGIDRYRLGFFRYEAETPIVQQLEKLKPTFNELADLNGRLGLQGLYQNHSGWSFVGATLWDTHRLMGGLDPSAIAAAFDIRHATIEAGLSWEILYRLMKTHIGAVYVKDFVWKGRKAAHAPLGATIDPEFFDLLSRDGFDGPLSLHVEYLPKAGTQANISALRTDLATLRGWLG